MKNLIRKLEESWKKNIESDSMGLILNDKEWAAYQGESLDVAFIERLEDEGDSLEEGKILKVLKGHSQQAVLSILDQHIQSFRYSKPEYLVFSVENKGNKFKIVGTLGAISDYLREIVADNSEARIDLVDIRHDRNEARKLGKEV